MKKGKVVGKIFGMALVFVLIGTMLGGLASFGTDSTSVVCASSSSLPSTIRVLRLSTGTVDTVDFKLYTKRVLPQEWIASWPSESLKAGAMAVKTYAWYWIEQGGRHPPDADVCDGTHCQVYNEQTYSATNDAVEATWLRAMKQSGALFNAQYWDGRAVVSTGGSTLNIRSGPGTSYPVTAHANNGDELCVLSNGLTVSGGYHWFFIKTGGVTQWSPGSYVTGWVAGEYVNSYWSGQCIVNYTDRMTQWGSKYWADQGKDYQWILSYFYPGISFSDIAVDTVPPTVNAFSVIPSSVTSGNAFTISYTVSDTGGSGLGWIQLWRKYETASWEQVNSATLSGVGNGPYSGSFYDTPLAVGTYWYGIHIGDDTGNWITEGGSGFSPIEVEVIQANSQPQLSSGYVDPSNGTPSTNFYYYVTYFDPDGDSPSVRQVIIDGTAYTMSLYSGSASNGVYRYGPKNLSAGGTHYYFFYYEDGKGGWDRLPSGVDMYLGPTVTGPNNPPNTPSNPSPTNHATGVSINSDLSWSSGDPDAGDTVTYDVYFGTSSTPPLVSNDQSAATYDPGTLSYNTKYYWKIVATDNHGASTTGLLWDFTTTPADQVVTFPDPNLEAAIRQAIGKPAGDIYQSDLDGLTSLSATSRNIVNLSGLEHCTSLTYLDLGANQISDISPLSSLTSLAWLSLWSNQISDISPLSSLTSLIGLNLGYNQISNISPLSNLASLTGLTLVYNQISDISPLLSLTNLSALWLSGNQISDISPLSSLTGLTTLLLDANQISDISPLLSLTSLTELWLNANQISDISPLSTLTNLSALWLSGNQISDISPLSSLTSLEMLWLGGNQISNISPFSQLANLKGLYLDDNQIIDITPLASLTKLGEASYYWCLEEREGVAICLGLQNNHVSDVQPLISNAGLAQGGGIDLRGNPLSANSLNTYIPQLQARGVTVLYDTTPADTTPPTTPLVIADGGSFAGTMGLHASWSSSDPESGIVEYQYTMGTSAGGTDVVSWTSAGTASEVTEPVTGLSVGTTYYFAVKAKNSQGLWSEVGASNGITVAAVVLDLPSDWMDKQLFYPIYSRVANSPGSVVIGVGNKRDMWYLVEVYTRTQEQPVWTPLLPQQWNVGEYYLPILQPYGTRTFTYTPKLGEEIKIVVSNNLNDEVLRSLYYLDFATRALLGISISPALTDNPEFIAKLFNLIPTLSTSVGYLFQGEFREAIKSLALELGTETVQVSFSELLSMIGISATKEALAGAALSVAANLLINAPIYGPLFDNTNKAPFIEEVIYTSKAKIKFAPSDIRVIDSLRLVESAPYNSGETITAEFTIVNRDVAPVKLTLLTASGRGPRGDTDIHDFTFDTDVILNPGECHSYEGELFLSDTGQYHFFVAYQTADGVWCTSVPTEGSATNTLDIEVGPLADRLAANLCSPGELRVYDSQDRVTGLVNGQVKQEIPDSIYFEQDRIVVIYSPSDTYRYEVAGTDEGTYGLDITLIEDGGAMIFAATDIPTTSGVVHDYTIDWEALLEGEEGVTVHIDADGDGVFEEIITADSELTHDEFMLQTETTIDFDPDTLNLKDKDKYVTAYIELPLGHNVSQINISSIRLNGTVPALTKPTKIGDHDRDRVRDLMVKFDAGAVKRLLTPGRQVITITGEVAGITFEGSDTIRVIKSCIPFPIPWWPWR
jgi:Leucine-rich repeat (LRR) protein/uncharacterized protein YraI